MTTIAEQIAEDGYNFDFFRAVQLLERMLPERRSVGEDGPPAAEVVKLRVHNTTAFPASAIQSISIPSDPKAGPPAMLVNFMGLTGPSGVLPRHYTDMIFRTERETRGDDRYALRAWLDLFNHRMISHFFRAWRKYRFYAQYEGIPPAPGRYDLFTFSLLSLVGLGATTLQDRLRVAEERDEHAHGPEKTFAEVDDLALLHFAGLLSNQRRPAVSLESLLHGYFGLPFEVGQFQGQWLVLNPSDVSRLDPNAFNNTLGFDLIVGTRVWDVQSKIRLRVGPLTYQQFVDLLPDPSPTTERKRFFLLVHLARLFLGAEFDFDVQLILKAEEAKSCTLSEQDGIGPRLGWNTWIAAHPFQEDADDAIFDARELTTIPRPSDAPRPAAPDDNSSTDQ